LGSAQMGDLEKVGRVGGKALLYFEIVTTLAIMIGLIVAHVIEPGKGVHVAASSADLGSVKTYAAEASEMNWGEFFFHIIPHNVFDSFSRGDVIQILFFAVLFGFALSKMGNTGHSLIGTFEKLLQVIFNIMKVVMKLAHVGAFGGMAFTIGAYGVDALLPLGKLMVSVYLTMALFIFGVLNFICYCFNFSLWKYLKFIREEIVIVLGTSSS